MTNPHKILLVDDEVAHLKTLERLFEMEGYIVFTATGGKDAIVILQQNAISLVITDLMMPDIDGIEVLKHVCKTKPQTETILMSAFGTVERAVQGMKEGAYDFVTKPIKRAVILKAARQALDRQALVAENKKLRAQIAELTDERAMIGQSNALRSVIALVKQVADTDVTVLITGESGTGKELVARMLVERSTRANAAFITVNCAALPESILEGELFGFEKGAFTGASQAKIGKFEAANGGTIFLDEIGELSPSVQVKLLRVLQEQEFDRLGSTVPTKINVRILAATNRDLDEEIASGNFRKDLYYRLNVLNIHVPPLRDRRTDIPFLADHFLNKLREKNRRSISGFTGEAIDYLTAYTWPGNVRELENVVERAVVLDKDSVIGVEDLPPQITHLDSAGTRILEIQIGTSLEEIERQVIHETLRSTHGDKKEAAKLLGIATRTIYRKI